MSRCRAVSVRLPEIRQALLREVRVVRSAVGEVDEIALGDAVEEVWHLLDPSHGGEPGDLLLSDVEVVLGTTLWRALERAPWPADPETRATDPAWNGVVHAAVAFLDGTATHDR